MGQNASKPKLTPDSLKTQTKTRHLETQTNKNNLLVRFNKVKYRKYRFFFYVTLCGETQKYI